jgi:hypothetical protein
MSYINPLNAKLNPICHLLVLLVAHHILHVSINNYVLLNLARKLHKLDLTFSSCVFIV